MSHSIILSSATDTPPASSIQTFARVGTVVNVIVVVVGSDCHPYSSQLNQNLDSAVIYNVTAQVRDNNT